MEDAASAATAAIAAEIFHGDQCAASRRWKLMRWSSALEEFQQVECARARARVLSARTACNIMCITISALKAAGACDLDTANAHATDGKSAIAIIAPA